MAPQTTDIRGNILLVDDNPTNLQLLSDILKLAGHQVRRTVSSKLAIQAVQTQPPDIILLDVDMPDMDGYHVCQILKADPATRSIPVVFISALNQPADKVRAFEVGGSDYIMKPFHATEVIARVRNQLLLQSQQRHLIDQNNLLQHEINLRHQAESQLQRLNMGLERQVKARTAELQLAFEFEATLKRITDQVRDTLDEDKILETAVRELALAIGVNGCNASLYNLEKGTATVFQEYTTLPQSYIGRVLRLQEFPELYGPLLNGQPVQFCSLLENPDRGPVVMLACPIFDNRGVIGDLWLNNHSYYAFHEQDIRLVQQVANQCAIALRQAHLYKASQTQIVELERLNRLKDDFLSTVSHELRTPMSNIKALSQVLDDMLHRQLLGKERSSEEMAHKLARYLSVLKDECDREIKLINDLLYLSGVDADVTPPSFIGVAPNAWIPYVVEPFKERIQAQQQTLVLDVPNDLPKLQTDLKYMERILSELLHNAYKYTPPQETISVSATATDHQLSIHVMNSGIEIPNGERDRIFEKFYRIPSNDPWKHGGTGLGLALVKKLANHLGVEISVAGRPNQTIFTVDIPLLDPIAV
ncbi:MAG: response regulator [Synechococcales bacterium]|nr:response regulator [Synechococcales bacterium]